MEQYTSGIRLFGFDFAPKGWTKRESQLLSVGSNPALYALPGNHLGGDSKTNFALPDLQGRIIAGSGARYLNHQNLIYPFVSPKPPFL
jgi:microcystin-dependent protein